jgi:hypothetical protein
MKRKKGNYNIQNTEKRGKRRGKDKFVPVRN